MLLLIRRVKLVKIGQSAGLSKLLNSNRKRPGLNFLGNSLFYTINHI